MTAIPLLVPDEPAQWVLLDLQGDISLRQMALGGNNHSADKPQPNAIHTYGGLELGVFKQHNVSSHTPRSMSALDACLPVAFKSTGCYLSASSTCLIISSSPLCAAQLSTAVRCV